MKVQITHLKAPWPAGVAVGHVVDLAADTVPGWALGKCTPTDDDAEAFATLAAPAAPALVANPASEEDLQAAAALAAAEAQAAEEAAALAAAEATKGKKPKA
jgi:hypothetical protein